MESTLEALARLGQWSKDGHAEFKRVCGVQPGRWLQMEQQHGIHEACKIVLLPHPETWWSPILVTYGSTNFCNRASKTL